MSTPPGSSGVAAEEVPPESVKKAEEFIEAEEGAANKLEGWLGAFLVAAAFAMSAFHLYTAYAIVPTQTLRPVLRASVVDCVFEDWKGGGYKIISFFAKRARGAVARWAIRQRVQRVDALTGFDADGYRHDPAASEPGRLVFRRRIVGTP